MSPSVYATLPEPSDDRARPAAALRRTVPLRVSAAAATQIAGGRRRGDALIDALLTYHVRRVAAAQAEAARWQAIAGRLLADTEEMSVRWQAIADQLLDLAVSRQVTLDRHRTHRATRAARRRALRHAVRRGLIRHRLRRHLPATLVWLGAVALVIAIHWHWPLP